MDEAHCQICGWQLETRQFQLDDGFVSGHRVHQVTKTRRCPFADLDVDEAVSAGHTVLFETTVRSYPCRTGCHWDVRNPGL